MPAVHDPFINLLLIYNPVAFIKFINNYYNIQASIVIC